jgi:hypothetical protein
MRVFFWSMLGVCSRTTIQASTAARTFKIKQTYPSMIHDIYLGGGITDGAENKYHTTISYLQTQQQQQYVPIRKLIRLEPVPVILLPLISLKTQVSTSHGLSLHPLRVRPGVT